jgi:UDP-N-acetylmuramyl pentapeptide phosphotransferase/UDP-N-acetylglucosamine-1-phosphate transferase
MFTAISVAGIANAINIIDGFNGLSSGTVMIILASLGSIAVFKGDVVLANHCLLLGSAVFGFWLVNFPLGKLFLGDGGAYFVGFSLAWLAVLLLMRNPSLSPWLVLLASAYPVIEVLYSVWRRKRIKQPTGGPDNLHLHSVVKTQVILPLLSKWPAVMRNAAVSPIIWLYAALPSGMAILLVDASVWMIVACLILSVVIYHLLYRYLMGRHARSVRAASQTKSPLPTKH